MRIKDCQTLLEFFGVDVEDYIWVEGQEFRVFKDGLGGAADGDSRGRALVGCLTGQLEWSTDEPMTAEEEKVIREIAAWFPWWKKMNLSSLRLNGFEAIRICYRNGNANYPFWYKDDNSKAYKILIPILEKYGEINLDDYRGSDHDHD